MGIRTSEESVVTRTFESLTGTSAVKVVETISTSGKSQRYHHYLLHVGNGHLMQPGEGRLYTVRHISRQDLAALQDVLTEILSGGL
jgi:hypothetical protein